MIVDEVSTQTQNTNSSTKASFLNQFIWKESSKGKFFLDKRECFTAESTQEAYTEILTFDMEGYERDPEGLTTFQPGETVVSELGKLEVVKVEENQVFLKMGEDEIPVPMESVKNKLNLNFLILGKTKNHLIEKVLITLSSDFSSIKNLLSEYLSIPSESITLSFKENIISNETVLHKLEIAEEDTILVSFALRDELVFKRSGNKDYSWYDAKNVIPFNVDKNILVSAFGFWRHTDNVLATYDFSLYEMRSDGSKHLVTQLNGVKVLTSECDSEYIKKVSVTPLLLKAGTNYKAYVYYKIADQRTYFSYSCSNDQVFEGVRFRFTEVVEANHKCSSTSGHLPSIYFKIYNPYEA
jgi:hypothetical protein